MWELVFKTCCGLGWVNEWVSTGLGLGMWIQCPFFVCKVTLVVLCKNTFHLVLLSHHLRFLHRNSVKSVKVPMLVQVLIFLVILLGIALLIGLCYCWKNIRPRQEFFWQTRHDSAGWLESLHYFDGSRLPTRLSSMLKKKRTVAPHKNYWTFLMASVEQLYITRLC